MTAEQIEEMIKKLLAQGVTVLMFVLGPAGEMLGVTPAPGGSAPAAITSGPQANPGSCAEPDGSGSRSRLIVPAPGSTDGGSGSTDGGSGSTGPAPGGSGGTGSAPHGSRDAGPAPGDSGGTRDAGDASGESSSRGTGDTGSTGTASGDRGTGPDPGDDGSTDRGRTGGDEGGTGAPDRVAPGDDASHGGVDSGSGTPIDCPRPDATGDGSHETRTAPDRDDRRTAPGDDCVATPGGGHSDGTGSGSGSGTGSGGQRDAGPGGTGGTGSGTGDSGTGDADSGTLDHSGSGSGDTSGNGTGDPGGGTPGDTTPGGTGSRPGGTGSCPPSARQAPSGDATTGGGGQMTSDGTTAASKLGWGEPVRADDFENGTSGWNIYDGPGHAGNGTRTPDAVSVHNGVLTITGDGSGNTAGMAWTEGSQQYGRWEGRVRAPASDPSYNALLLLWPTAENFPEGGEIDFMEMMDPSRQKTNIFVHYGADNSQIDGAVDIDATDWHNWAVEWTPEKITAYVDGEQWFETTDQKVQPPGPMHLCIQLDWFPKGGSVEQSTMEVDWVRQYSLDGGPQGGTTLSSATG